MSSLPDKLWAIVQPHLQPGQKRSPEMFHYRLTETVAAVYQAEGLLVALEAQNPRDALIALLNAERWAAIRGRCDPEVAALLYVASERAFERVLLALPEKGLNDD